MVKSQRRRDAESDCRSQYHLQSSRYNGRLAEFLDDGRIKLHSYDKKQEADPQTRKRLECYVSVQEIRQKYGNQRTSYNVSYDHRLFEDFHNA